MCCFVCIFCISVILRLNHGSALFSPFYVEVVLLVRFDHSKVHVRNILNECYICRNTIFCKYIPQRKSGKCMWPYWLLIWK